VHLLLQEVGDARRIRNRILSNFELATQPNTSSDESQRLLHIVIVGGGPTGVEFGAEVYDFVEQVQRKFMKKLWKGIVNTTIYFYPFGLCLQIDFYNRDDFSLFELMDTFLAR
jgi:hypothetical protein